MRRRDFLATAALAPFAGLPSFAKALEAAPRKLLILVELRGGNDGLNTVVPYDDPLYRELRPRIGIAREQVVALTDKVGLHPSLAPLRPLWDARELAVVQGVGYPHPNLSHFRSIEIWDTASASDQYLDEGWLARAFDAHPSPQGFAADGVAVGGGSMGPLGGGKGRCIALADPAQFVRNARLARGEGEGETRNAALAHILRVERDVLASAGKLDANRKFESSFPAGPFGAAVHTAAQLAANDAGVAAVRISLGSFDTHANQQGVHANLLRQLGEGLVALRAALIEAGRWKDTVIASYGEFGRRARENQSGGTDHGTSSAHFVVGGAVKGGIVGAAPALDRLDSEGNLPHAVDFRGYYATFLERWWGIDSKAILGGRFDTLPFL